MKQSFLYYVMLLSALLFLTGCETEIEVIDFTIVNNTDQKLLSCSRYREPADTVLPESSLWPNGIGKEDVITQPHSKHERRFVLSWIKNAINRGECFSVYYFDVDTIISVPWEKIRAEHNVVKRVDFRTMEELYSYHNVITIP